MNPKHPFKWRHFGCVAKTGSGLVKVVFVLTTLSHRHPIHEPQAPLQVASLPIRHHPAVCAVVSTLPALVPQPGGDDVGTGTHGGPFDGVPLGELLHLLLDFKGIGIHRVRSW